MDVVTNLLFWLHLACVAVGGAPSFGMAVVGSKMPTATPETRATLFSIGHGLERLGRASFGTLIVTGLLLGWLKFGGFGAFPVWFWVKMVLVVLLLVAIIYTGTLAKRAEGGDRQAEAMLPRVGSVNIVLFMLVILSAVFAFN